jgi:acetoin:2,6-dichlorophenolindophenol oxidoreductase subunit beta
VEEIRGCAGGSAELVSIVADKSFCDLDGPPARITTPHVAPPAVEFLEDIALPSVDGIAERVQRRLNT